jgi:hypothetical protein
MFPIVNMTKWATLPQQKAPTLNSSLHISNPLTYNFLVV